MIAVEVERAARVGGPYPGLVPYGLDDAAFFFGRAREARLVAANLWGSRLTLLYGPSGVGKTSLLLAGAVRQLEDTVDEAARSTDAADAGVRPELAVAVCRSWVEEPLPRVLTAAHAAIIRALGGRVVEPPRAGAPAVATLERWTEHVQRLLLVFDQFEEYFLYHPASGDEESFDVQLARILESPRLRVNVLLSLREDALARLDRFKGRVRGLYDNMLRVDHLDRRAAREAITRPIEAYNRLQGDSAHVEIESALVGAVLAQVESGNVALAEAGRGAVGGRDRPGEGRVETALLQLVMERLWTKERAAGSGVLRLRTLEELGGAERIVRTYLHEAMAALPEAEQDLAAAVFRHLVTPSGTKISHLASDLADLEGAPPERVAALLERLSAERIVRPVTPGGSDEEPRYEIFHDVLAPAILDWRAGHVREVERRRLEGELAERERQRRAAEQQAGRERGAARRFRVVAAAAVVLAAAAAVLAVWAFDQKRAAVRERNSALTAQRKASTAEARADSARKIAEANASLAGAAAALARDPGRALQLTLRAIGNGKPSADERRLLRQALLSSHLAAVVPGRGTMHAAVLNGRGTRLLTASDDGDARVWRTADGRGTALAGSGRVLAGAFAPDGRRVVTGGADGRTLSWDAARPGTPTTLGRARGPIAFVAFSRDGSRLLTGGAGGWTVRDGHSGRLLFRETTAAPVREGRIDPDGTRVLLLELGHAELWDATARRRVALAQEPPATSGAEAPSVLATAFSPDDRRFATGSSNGFARVFDSRTGDEVAARKFGTAVTSVAIGPADRVAVGTADGTASVWRPGGEVVPLEGHTDTITSIAFSSDGSRVVTSSVDGTARVWTAATGAHEALLLGHRQPVVSAAFADSRTIVTASDDGTARLWHLAGPPSVMLPRHLDQAVHATFSGDGKRVLVTSVDGSALVADAATGRLLNRFGDPRRLSTAQEAQAVANFGDVRNAVPLFWEFRAALSGDGRRLVTGDFEGNGALWSVDDRRLIRRLPPTHRTAYVGLSTDGRRGAVAGVPRSAAFNRNVGAVTWLFDGATGRTLHILRGYTDWIGGGAGAITPDGRYVVSSSYDGTIRVWDAPTGSAARVLRSSRKRLLHSVAISADGARVAAATWDGTAQVWSIRSRKEPVTIGGNAAVRSEAFSPRSSLVVTAGDENSARVWNAATGKRVATLRGHEAPLNSARFSPNGRLVVTASDDGTVRVWQARAGEEWAEVSGGDARPLDASFDRTGTRIVVAYSDGASAIYRCDACRDATLLAAARKARPATFRH